MKKIVLLIMLLLSVSLSAQKQANFWYFGVNAGLDFERPNPIAVLDGQLDTLEGCATISDSDGNLLFYTDGVTVYNRDHLIMLNGTDLGGDSSSASSAIIIPKPLDANIYYIFTVDATFGDDGLQYSEVDMTLDGGLGGITANKNIFLETRTTEKLTATQSTIPNEYWVVSHRVNSNEFVSYRVSNTGVNTTPVVSAVGSVVTDDAAPNAIGQAKISPDGTKLAVGRIATPNEVQLFDFNATTGEVSNAQTVVDPDNDPTLEDSAPYGVEFSPDSNFLYVSLSNGVYQLNLNAGSTADILNSRVTLHSSTRLVAGLQLGPDERIYVAVGNNAFLDRIESPNTLGVASDYRTDEVSLNGRNSRFGLPAFIQSFLQPPNILFENQCFGDTTNFNIDENVQTITWDFGDPASGASNTSTDITPSHVFTAPGTYTVSATATVGSLAVDFSVEVIIFETPTIETQPDDLSTCDADGNGVEPFDLTVQTPVILGSQSASVFEVIYATDDTFSSPIADPENYNNTAPTETIHFRVFTSGNPSCFVNGQFTIALSNGVSVPSTVEDFVLCDDDTDGFIDSFLLSTKDAEILGSLDPTLYEVNYFVTEQDAIDNLSPIDKTVPYTNIVAFSQPIYVRVNAILEPLCSNTSLQFNLVVSPIPVVNPLVELRQCDDDTDGFSLFNLNEATQEISANFANETFVFYPTEIDAQNDTNRIADPIAYQNQTVTTDTVWARTISLGGCFEISEVQLIVSTTVIPASFQATFSACDDFLDVDGNDTENNDETDGITFFDFSDVNDDVIALFPPNQQLIIGYYRNLTDALAEQNAIEDISNYRNVDSPFSQQIYIRVDSELDNDCLGLGPFITLTVDPVPETITPNDLDLCDDDTDGIASGFNLEAQTSIILGTQDPANFTVTYHTSRADAAAGINAIVTSDMYTNITPNLQTIYVRVVNDSTGCFTAQTSFDLIVNAIPVANPVPNLEICDDDSDGSARNGFSQSFDLESLTSDILGPQDPNQFTVTYHSSLSNAQLGILPLESPFSNSIPFQQTLYVRVLNGDTGCANGITTFDVIVNPEPMAAEVSNLSYCDDDLDGDDTNGFVQNIDLDSQIDGILDFDTTGQNPDDYTVTFHQTQNDASSGSNALASPYSNSIANQQTIFVRIVNDATGCVNDDFTFEVIVNPLPEFEVTTPQIVCLNGPQLNLFVEFPNTVYDYVWTDPSGNTEFGEEISISSGGLYSVTATTTDGTGCSRTKEIQVDESIIATITEQDITIVDDSDNNSITINTTNLGIGDYEFALVDENNVIIRNYQDSPIFENLEGNIYTVLINDKNGCGVASLEISVVEFPKFFTPNNDGINDSWIIKGVNSRFFQESQLNIFNRYGRLLVQLNLNDAGWDGTFNGRVLPSDDYWFSVTLIDRNGNLRERKGNMSLLRRER